jgi:hypothetical protein
MRDALAPSEIDGSAPQATRILLVILLLGAAIRLSLWIAPWLTFKSYTDAGGNGGSWSRVSSA